MHLSQTGKLQITAITFLKVDNMESSFLTILKRKQEMIQNNPKIYDSNMRDRIILMLTWLFLVFSFFTASFGFNDRAVAGVQGKTKYENYSQPVREIKVAAASNWSPYSERDKKGNGVGVAYDLIKRIVEPMGIVVIIAEDKPWKRYVTEIQDGSLDIILTAYKVNPFGEYSEHYAIDEIKIFVKPGKEFEFNRIQDLSTRTGVQPKGAGYDITFSQRAPGPAYTMRENADAKKCIEMVLNDDGDYYVSAYYDVLEKLKTSGYEGRLIDLKKPVYIEEVVMVVSKKSSVMKLIPEINKKIRELRVNGTIKKIIDVYAQDK